MAKIRDLATAEDQQRRTKKLASYGLSCYLTEGISQRFLDHLNKFSTSIFHKYGVKGDLDWWLDEARDKVIDRLRTVYDPDKGPLVPFIMAILKNKATNVSRREGRKVVVEEGEEDYFSKLEGAEYVKVDTDAYVFQERALRMGLEIDIALVLKNFHEGYWSPMARAFAWLKLKGSEEVDDF